MMLPEIQGVILIDVWSSSKSPMNNWYNHCAEKIQELCPDAYFVNASYNTRWDYENPGRDNSQLNLLRIYHELDIPSENPPEEMFVNSQVPMRVMSHCKGLSTTTEHFKNLFSTTNSVMLLDLEDFMFHNIHYLKGRVKNWLVAGKTWDMCAHTRPMGLNNLAKLLPFNFEFYATDWSICTHNAQPLNRDFFIQDHLDWKELPGFGYQLLV